jgi:hypothetical protein
MAAYPSYNILLESTQERDDGILDDYAPIGTQHSRILHSEAYWVFALRHNLTLAQWQSLRSTYNSGPRDVYTLSYLTESPLVTYSVKFTGPPRIVSNVGGDRFIVESRLRGTQD